MNGDLLKAVGLLEADGGLTCALCMGEKAVTSNERGIKPLIKLLKSGESFSGFSAADKIVGKAAALLYVMLGVCEVYAAVMSENAAGVFEENNIKYSCSVLTKQIINREGTGICPMELAVRNISDPREAFGALEAKIRELNAVGFLKAGFEHCGKIHKMQTAAFKTLLEKYKDSESNPGAETLEQIQAKMKQDFTDYYFIKSGEKEVGAVRIVRISERRCRIAPIFILPEFQGRGYASQALFEAEQLYPKAESWELDTIKEEQKLCRLYEKAGYKRIGKEKKLQEGMTIVYYVKYRQQKQKATESSRNRGTNEAKSD